MTVILTPSGPELRLLVSLASWTWPGTSPDGREVAHILITHNPAFTGPDAAEAVEARMRRLSDCLGGLASSRAPVRELARCLQVVGGQVLMSFPGTARKLRLPTHAALDRTGRPQQRGRPPARIGPTAADR